MMWAIDVPAQTPNPHHDLECTECHPQKPQDEIPLQEKKELGVVLEEMTSCLKCHEENTNLHPLGVFPPKPSLLLPVDEKKGITCLTCHFMHAETTEYSLLRGFTDGKFKILKDMCYQCHGLAFYQKNPHRKSDKQDRCSFCHQSTPKGKISSQVRRLCRFCHSKQVHKTTQDHLLKDCTECHAPHGSTDTVDFLREDFVLSQPREVNPHKDEGLCHRCHTDETIQGQSVGFLYGGNFIVLCTSCHWTQNFMHPMEVTIPSRMQVPSKLPLSSDKKIICPTCHDACSKHKAKDPKFLRLQPEHKIRNDLCFECHSRKRYSKIDPHRDQHKREKCLFCHDHDGQLSYKASSRKVVLKSTGFVLCLRCHVDKNTPNFSSHTSHKGITPVRLVTPAGFPLDSQGRLTCTTCHNPHLWGGVKTSLRGELPKKRFCQNCHLDL